MKQQTPEKINYNLRQKVWFGMAIGLSIFWGLIFYLMIVIFSATTALPIVL